MKFHVVLGEIPWLSSCPHEAVVAVLCLPSGHVGSH